MDQQQIFNVAISLISVLIGWIINVIWQAVKELQKADKEIVDKVASIEILVAGQYVKREELLHLTEALFKKLDKIEEKLDRKVDK